MEKLCGEVPEALMSKTNHKISFMNKIINYVKKKKEQDYQF